MAKIEKHITTLDINGYQVDCTVAYTYADGYRNTYHSHGPHVIEIAPQVAIADIYYLDAGAQKQSLYDFIADRLPNLLADIMDEIKDEESCK